MKSDSVYKKTKSQLSKAYNDALEYMLKKNTDYFKIVQKVQDGKIAPPSGLRTENQIEAWKRGYLQRYLKKNATIDSMVKDLQDAGVKVRKNVLNMMRKTYGIEEQSVISNLGAKKVLVSKNDKQIQILLDKKMTVFDKGALNSLKDADLAKKRLRREFAYSIQKGEGKQKILARIKRITKMSENDALRVLETERTRVIGMAQQATAEDYSRLTGKKAKKKWICSFHNSRESHIDTHGDVVDFDKPFSNGLMYPGDPNAPAGETVNCRCRMEVFDDGE